MAEETRQRLRTTFEEVADAFDRARPSYPPAIFDDLAELAELRPGARVVEVGCGTGKATVPLAERGYRVVGVELGVRLAAVARRKLAAYPAATVVAADFETWAPRPAGFDAVVAFTAFHWLDPERRYERAAALLRDGGALAVVETQHVLPADGDPFFREVQADYEAVAPDDEATRRGAPGPPEEVGDLAAEMEASGGFRIAGVRRHLWDVVYGVDEYLAVLDTYSGHRALRDVDRRRLYGLIRRRIEARPERTVRKTYLATLTVGRYSG